MAGLLLSLITAPDGRAGEWESIRESYDNRLKAHARRITEIEARERGFPADQEKRAEKITKDRISGVKGSMKSGGKARSLVETAEKASADSRTSIDVYREQADYLDIVVSEWGTEGTERKKLRESIATLQKNLESANASLARAIEGADATARRVLESGLPEKAGRIVAAEKERARWLREQAALERERQQRERATAERERGVR